MFSIRWATHRDERNGSLAEKKRSKESRNAAELYAPQPEGSSILYGLIAIVVLAIAFWIVGLFYGLNFLSYPVLLIGAGAVAFIGGVLLRKLRKRRHNDAYRHEYGKRP